MKKIVAVVMAVMTLFAVTGCSCSKKIEKPALPETTPAPTAAPTAVPTPEPTPVPKNALAVSLLGKTAADRIPNGLLLEELISRADITVDGEYCPVIVLEHTAVLDGETLGAQSSVNEGAYLNFRREAENKLIFHIVSDAAPANFDLPVSDIGKVLSVTPSSETDEDGNTCLAVEMGLTADDVSAVGIVITLNTPVKDGTVAEQSVTLSYTDGETEIDLGDEDVEMFWYEDLPGDIPEEIFRMENFFETFTPMEADAKFRGSKYYALRLSNPFIMCEGRTCPDEVTVTAYADGKEMGDDITQGPVLLWADDAHTGFPLGVDFDKLDGALYDLKALIKASTAKKYVGANFAKLCDKLGSLYKVTVTESDILYYFKKAKSYGFSMMDVEDSETWYGLYGKKVGTVSQDGKVPTDEVYSFTKSGDSNYYVKFTLSAVGIEEEFVPDKKSVGKLQKDEDGYYYAFNVGDPYVIVRSNKSGLVGPKSKVTMWAY